MIQVVNTDCCPCSSVTHSLKLLRKAWLSVINALFSLYSKRSTVPQHDRAMSFHPDSLTSPVALRLHASEYEFCVFSLSFFSFTPSTSSKL